MDQTYAEMDVKQPMPISPGTPKGDALSVVMDSALSIADDNQHDLPSYEDSTVSPRPATDNLPEVFRLYRRLEIVPWSHYVPPGGQLNSDATTVTLNNTSLTHNLASMTELVMKQIMLPPQPRCKIHGRHTDRSYPENAVDFDLHLNLAPYLLGQAGCRPGSIRWADAVGRKGHTRGHAAFEAEIRNAITTSFRNPEKAQCIVIDRQVTNLDKEAISNHLFGLIGQLRYKGEISITFPITQTRVVINLPTTAVEKENRGFFGNIISTVTSPKQTCTIQANWPFASAPGPSDDDAVGAAPVRTFTTKSEHEWFADWEAVLRRSIVRKEKGAVGIDSWVQNMTDPLRKAELPKADWASSAW